MPANENIPNICPYFQKGICKYGKACRNLHIKPSTNGSAAATAGAGSLSDIRSWRQNSASDKSTVPFAMPLVTKSDNNFMMGNADPVQLQIDFATMLPQTEDIPKNEIPVNKQGHRLDAYIPPPSHEDRAAFQARIAIQKLCNNHHLNGTCPNGGSCEYDHSPISLSILNCLKQVASNNPCPRRGACRSLSCLHGHICQRAECKYRGGKLYCKIPPQIHLQDLNVFEYVSGTAPRNGGSVDDLEASESVSGRGSTPPMSGTRSTHNGSDGEVEEGEGALLDFGDDASVD